MVYSVKEIFLTIQGEGGQSGLPAVFLRFSGCNLWNGLESGRAEAVCQFCDTDFIGTDGPGGGKFSSAAALAETVATHWPKDQRTQGNRWVVCTGGEPLLQLDTDLIDALHGAGFKIAVESNGTVAAPAGIDWLCISPKADTSLVQTTGDELKLVFPQVKNHPEDFAHLAFPRFYLQPRDGSAEGKAAGNEANLQAVLAYIREHPQWRLSLQTHKLIGIP